MKLILRLLLTGAFLLSCNWAFSGDIELKINKKYLNFPVSHKQERAKMTFKSEGKPDLSVVAKLIIGCLKMFPILKVKQ